MELTGLLPSANLAIVISCLLVGAGVFRAIRRNKRKTTALKGPRGGLFFGVYPTLLSTEDQGRMFEDWEIEYGSVFQIPGVLGKKDLVLCDPKAVAHHYFKDTYTYQQTPMMKFMFENFFGRNLLWAEADTHKRQRKALSPAFSNAAIRNLTSVFYDSAYTLKNSWESSFQANTKGDTLTIDVQKWMNHVSLDSIGIAGFSHDFGSLKGRSSAVVAAFQVFEVAKPTFMLVATLLLAPLFPSILNLPGQRKTSLNNLAKVVRGITDDILERARDEGLDATSGGVDRSIIGALVKSENANPSSQMSPDEVAAQIYLLILAGYETTAISLTWALIELSRTPEVQTKLREELLQFSAGDPTWDQLTNSMPYLDAVTCETLRLHPPGTETTRQAYEDDIIPLSKPMPDASGRLVDSIFVAKGTNVRVPLICVNRSEALWGQASKDFVPERWLDGSVSTQRAAEIQGYRHLLTFVDGPRTCLGKGFALTEFKAVLSVLIRNFSFEFPDGPDTKIERHQSILDRPKVAGQDGAKVPLLVRRVEM